MRWHLAGPQPEGWQQQAQRGAELALPVAVDQRWQTTEVAL